MASTLSEIRHSGLLHGRKIVGHDKPATDRKGYGEGAEWTLQLYFTAVVQEETIETFVWLLRELEKCHQVRPQEIFIDQDSAAIPTIEEVEPDVLMIFDDWHVNQSPLLHWSSDHKVMDDIYILRKFTLFWAFHIQTRSHRQFLLWWRSSKVVQNIILWALLSSKIFLSKPPHFI